MSHAAPTVASTIESHGLDHWHEVVCRKLIGIEVVPEKSASFDGRFMMMPMGDATLAHVEATALTAYRSERRIADDTEPGFLINVLLSGHGRTTQCGNHSELRAGDIFMQDTALPYSLELGSRAALLTLRAPRPLILRHLTPSERMCGIPLARDGMARVAVASLISLADVAPMISDAEREIALGSILPLLAAASSTLSSRASTPSHMGYARANRFIETHIKEPSLGTATVAAACGMSARQLTRLFEAEGETVSRVILRRRLERCRLDLLSPTLAHRTIGEIAFAWGFNNLSHFSESFRRAYGCSPRAYRQRGCAR
ncbi:helix-turn-helix domain-containing protein [Sphingomonas histidinilytica]|uniref:Transcriptional regulator, AraC family n=1 Tax=Rhizorhabdus histidinilytica TaxID=439228 RepID=A0A1T5GA06_9SPHN|nr:helix-turn-helix domain-containing protein [Rhizorhabdus histidinilytica]MBO9379895.1 helix-turn-helix domain-containing protein [Rhizorhabdus histidinilytica]QEH77133.1 helix-turn-helix domain-containing protein [Sphingomonas sp. C8-2]SKC05229.1 transcriptional regulator, AraC family [Rhizorhabdus histidinilytica]